MKTNNRLKRGIGQVQALVNRVYFRVFHCEMKIKVDYDNTYGERLYLQVVYSDRCRKTGLMQEWHGRKWYLSDYMTDDEIIKTAYAACKAAVEHEIMEGFTVDGKVLFNPHVHFEALLEITDMEVSRK